MSKKLVILTSIFLFCACGCTPASEGTVNSSEPIEENMEGDGYIDQTPVKTEDGNIFHAFCWKYKDITANLSSISEASFKSIQISPVQEPKNGGTTWWSFYQPLSFSIATNSSLGSKADLKELCDEAEKHGISIIADIVFNHLANIDDNHLESDGTPTVCPDVAQYEPEIYANRNASGEVATFHHNKNATGSGAVTQYYQWGNLPDLNTANSLVQQRSLDLLKECIDVGIDGFRLDAAKHIETPTDPQYASDFFPNVINAAKDYYKSKHSNQDLYVYGEILDDPDGGRTIDNYLPYIDVTDNKVKSSYVSASVRKDCSVLPKTSYTKNCDPSHIVYWAESHDDYTSGETIASTMQVNKVWAMMTARKGGRGLYLARQASRDNIVVGEVGSYLFENPSVGAVNRFHNRYLSYEENVIADEGLYICERYNDNDGGAVVVNLITAEGGENVTAKFSKLQDGLYCDQMTGKIVKVKNGEANIELHSSRVAVLTKSKNEPHPYFTISHRGGNFVGSLSLELNISEGEGTYQINNQEAVKFDSKTTVNLNSSMAVSEKIILKVKYGNSQFNYEKKYEYIPLSIKEGFFNVLNMKKDYFTNYEIYLWSWGSGNGHWSKDYTVENGVLLINLSTFKDSSFLIAIFAKGYVISNVNAWDDNKIKQTGDISISSKFYDASNF